MKAKAFSTKNTKGTKRKNENELLFFVLSMSLVFQS